MTDKRSVLEIRMTLKANTDLWKVMPKQQRESEDGQALMKTMKADIALLKEFESKVSDRRGPGGNYKGTL